MTLKNAIRKGDTTTHGGIVLEGLDNMPILGIPISCKGHMVYCPKCNDTYPIIDGVSSMPIGGKMPAVEGMQTACGAALIASQTQFKLMHTNGFMPTTEQLQFTHAQSTQSIAGRSNKEPIKSTSEAVLQSPSQRIFTVTAGHDSVKDPGAPGNGYVEAVLATELRNLIASGLKNLGHTIKTDGEEDDNWTLTEALKLIPGSDVAIEIHFNASNSSKACGVETISLNNTKDKTLSQQFSQAIAEVLNTKVRGDNGWIGQESSARGRLRYINAGGLILEICFISNKAEIDNYIANKQIVSDAIVKVLDDWAATDEKQTKTDE